MPLHLQKLCVGAVSYEDMEEWIAGRIEHQRRLGQPPEQTHVTRMMPSRAAEIAGAGSLFWVIKGAILARQPILELRPITDAEGISRCEIVLEPRMIRVEPWPRRPFQGWRYLAHEDAPRDLSDATASEGLPAHMLVELRELGLL
jgi:hypothetical protein